MMEEEWRDIKGYEGFYQVSNFGRIRRLSFSFTDAAGRKLSYSNDYILSPTKKPNGYLSVTLCKRGAKKRFLIHRLVGEAFLRNDKCKPQINHIDGNKTNNQVGNLEWCSVSENVKHSYDFLGHKNTSVAGEGHPHNKAIIQLSLDWKYLKRWSSAEIAGRSLNLKDGSCLSICARNIAKGIPSSSKGFRWVWEKNYRQDMYIPPFVKGNKKAIYQVNPNTQEIIHEFSCLEEAATKLRCNKSAISSCAHNKKKTAYGYKWIYKSEYNENNKI